tara:strand:- start:405 stop:1073 length:669 start_codon:yes stop_codon:yes gene_type:complete
MNVSKERLKKLWEESGSPYIKEMDLEGFKDYGWTRKKEVPRPEGISSNVIKVGGGYEGEDVKLWETEYDPETGKWYQTTPRAFFRTANPERKIDISNFASKWAKSFVPGLEYLYPTPNVYEDVRVPTDTAYVTPGNLNKLVAEMTHAGQYAPLSQQEIYAGSPRLAKEREKYGDYKSEEEPGVYGQEETLEYDAHSVRQPLLWDYLLGKTDKLELPPSWFER